MGTTGPTEERANSNSTNSEHGNNNVADNGTQPETTNENDIIQKRAKTTFSTPKTIAKWVLLFIIGGTIGILVFLFMARISIFSIYGSSMSPALENGDSVLLKQEAYVEAGQMVFFRPPTNWKEKVPSLTDNTMVKRIAAIPGDTLSFDGESFIVNGGERRYELPEGYDCSNAPQKYEITLSKKDAFVLGDNENNSIDSRYMFCNGYTNSFMLGDKYVQDYGKIIYKW